MQRATQAAARALAASAATEALVAPLVQLWRSADDAMERLRVPRALELFERTLVLAETTMPESTLLAAQLLQQLNTMRTALAVGGNTLTSMDPGADALILAAWRDDEQLLRVSQRSLGLLRARWAAGTLLTLTPAESCFVEAVPILHTPETWGVELFAAWASDALMHWPQASPALAGGADCLHGIHEALRAALAMRVTRDTRRVHLEGTMQSVLCEMLPMLLDDASWLHRLRSTCGLSQSDEAELRKLQQELLQGHEARLEVTNNDISAMGVRRAADVARHGLRSCALPACSATEQYRKTYKLCGRCRGAAYCCAAHSKEDWKRHKREDGCAPPP
jgi:hypothetical protein